MKRILLFDFDPAILAKISREFQFHGPIDVLSTDSVNMAMKHLHNHEINMIVAQLRMPKIRGLKILSHVLQKYPEIISAAFSEDESRNFREKVATIGIAHYFEAVPDSRTLVNIVNGKKAAKPFFEEKDIIKGIGLSSFLQMVEMEGKTCSLIISSNHKSGTICCRDGELITAEADTLKGNDAFFEILCWRDVLIHVNETCFAENRDIFDPLMHMLMEGSRIRDEREKDREPEAGGQAVPAKEKEEEDDDGEDITDFLVEDEEEEVSLIEVLNRPSDIYEYGIYDTIGRLQIKSEQALTITKLDPASSMRAGEELTGLLPVGDLEYIVIKGKDGIQYAFFKHGDNTIAAVLGPSLRPTELLSKLQ